MNSRTVAILITASSFFATATQAQVSARPDVAFKLATFAIDDGPERVGILIDDRLFDLQHANSYLVAEAGVPSVALPTDMKALIEQSDTTKPRSFQIANYLGDRAASLSFGYDPNDVSIKAPIKYPWNLLAAGQNYRAHAEERRALDAFTRLGRESRFVCFEA